MIGIIGGYGDVGCNAAKILSEKGFKVKIGGRHAEKFKLREQDTRYYYQNVDIENENSVLEFLDGCNGILNCAGPSHKLSIALANIVIDMERVYVDVGYPNNWRKLALRNSKKSIIFGAGSTPGLSGILPRFLGDSFDKVEDLFYCYSPLGKFSSSAAEDYLEGLFEVEKKASIIYCDGKEEIYKELPQTMKVLKQYVSYFYPYMDRESFFVISRLNLSNGQWYMGVNGSSTQSVLESARYSYLKDKEKTIKSLCDASVADLNGKSENVDFYIQLNGLKEGEKRTKTLYVNSFNPSYLTGYTAAITMILALENKLEAEVIPLGHSDHYAEFVECFTKNLESITFKVMDTSFDKMFYISEGII